MSQSYCGNECSNCEAKAKKQCPGCRVGPGQKYGTECEIAKCAISNSLADCDGCNSAASCSKRKRRTSSYANRTLTQERQQQSIQRQVEVSGILSKELTALFWLFIGSMIVNLICGIFDLAFQVEFFILICSIVTWLLQALIFLKLGRANFNFRVVAILGFASMAFDVLSLFVDHSALVLLVGLCQLAVVVAMEYLQFLGYVVVTDEFESDLSQKWNNLCVAHFVLLIVFGIAAALVLLGLTVAIWLAMLAGIGYLVTSIFKYIRLYQTARFFRDYYEEIGCSI